MTIEITKDKIEEGDYEEFFQAAMKKFGISSPDELKSDEKRKSFSTMWIKTIQQKLKVKVYEGKGSGRKVLVLKILITE